MPTIEVTDEQHDRLEALRAELAEEFVDGYGTVRQVDAVEYLLDLHAEAEDRPGSDAGGAPDRDDGETEASAADGAADSDGDTGDAVDGDDDDLLSAMMNLLEDHEEKWRETDADDGNYEVDLPDGGVEVVRTKDDIKAVLFEHY